MKKTLLANAVAVTLLSFTGASLAEDVKLESDQDKLSYGLGMMIGDRVLKSYGDVNYELLMKGIQAQAEGEETAMTLEEAQGVLQAQQQKQANEQAELAREAGKKFLDENAKRDGVQVTESGLQYEVVTDSDGEKPTINDTVTVHYVGTLPDGTTFDSSVDRGEPAQFPLKGVIPGWTEGLQLMTVGSKYRFVIPSDLAYGDRGAGPQIGPGATLVFEVELLEINK